MSKQIMLVSVHEDETRIATTDDGLLTGLHVQQTDRERKVGNIYKGRIVKVNPAFQAAFVDYGESRNGFLSISDINFSLFNSRDSTPGRPRIQNLVKEGQQVMVQILKEGLLNKGSALTTFVSLPGRYMVMTPNTDRTGISRKVEDGAVRQRLKETLEAISGGEELGIILRTAGVDRSASDLKKDLDGLRKQWATIESEFKKARKPGMLYQEPSPIVRVLRDHFTESVEEVWVDDADGYQEALRYFKSTMPRFQKRLKLYVGDQSLFSSYRVEEQISALDTSRVPLPSGGGLVIESTEALVSVDVNSGRSNQASDIEDTALQTNLEAAVEVARHLRLRNLGGLIVVDFIDMMSAKNRRTIEETMQEALRDDKARTTVGKISQFGLLELSRQRIDMELSHGVRMQCSNCSGTGYVPTVNSHANAVLRKLRELAATGRYGEIHGDLPLDSANFLLNEKRESVRDMELEFGISIRLTGDHELPAGQPISLRGIKVDLAQDPEAEHVEETVVAHRESEASSSRRRRRRGGRGRGREAEETLFTGAEGGASEHDDFESDHEEDDLRQMDAHDSHDTEDFDDEPTESTATEEPSQGRGRGRGRGRDRAAAAGNGREAPAQDVRPRQEERPRHEERPQRQERPRQEERPVAASRPTPSKEGKPAAFQSVHIITDPEALEKRPPAFERISPFSAAAQKVSHNTVLFDSNQSFGNGAAVGNGSQSTAKAPGAAAAKGAQAPGAAAAKGAQAPGAAAAKGVEAAAKPQRPPRRESAAGRPDKKDAAAKGKAPEAPAKVAAPADAGASSAASATSAGPAAKPAPRRRKGSGRGRPGGASAGVGAAKGNSSKGDAVLNEDDDNFGNKIAPEPDAEISDVNGNVMPSRTPSTGGRGRGRSGSRPRRNTPGEAVGNV